MRRFPQDFQAFISNKVPEVDYLQRVLDRDSDIALLAPHAGGIEPGTGKLAKSISGNDLSYYIFEGIQYTNNCELHLPSTQFNDPLCLNLLQTTKVAVSIHGCSFPEEAVFVGGLNTPFIIRILEQLNTNGFCASRDQTDHSGKDPSNICNLCESNKGVQLELSRPLRKSFFRSLDRPGREHPTVAFNEFVIAIRNALLG
ncbi:MAG: poly-gamma-glutamate hydrolase family protein [Anaerolineales bacterium]|nr:poly-gamma-glutamate hydrolase family protein [Anaerolineales bacterium]